MIFREWNLDGAVMVLIIWRNILSYISSLLHSSHDDSVWERRRDFDTKLWETVRLRPDGDAHSLQLHWLKHQWLHPAGCSPQGSCVCC